MHVFVTGGTGLIGSAVVHELIDHGHDVVGLARSESSARALAGTGAEVVRGTLADVATLRQAARASDAVVNLAFAHEAATPEDFAGAVAQEGAALRAMGEELVGTDRPFVVASGTPWMPGRLSTEQDDLPAEGPVAGRVRSVQAVLALADHGVRASAVRMARTVHRDGRGGFAGLLTDAARRTGVAGYPGDGTQRWPAVHALDAAALVRLALEGAPAGSVWHAVADEGDRVRDIAAVVGRRLGLPVRSVPEDTFGPLGPIFAVDGPASSAHTRRELGWEPTHPSLLDDLENLEP
ncbi:SDR family oxidoreductase [Solicola sp. PLA-1-18]|uniref:SDR family oxidoreductase n=1 Tax=Solicola sp. PLA-1-18 TaxID=3380532 RepID=UPI003B7CC651